MPIYLPEVISLHVKGELFSKETSKKDIKIEKKLLRIKKDFQLKINEIFKENLIFGFIFGSISKRTARFWTARASDLDTFICLKEREVEQEALFKKWLIKFHWEYGLRPDFDYLSEIVTRKELEDVISYLERNSIDLHYNGEKEFNAIIWLFSLAAGKKLAVIGDKKQLSSLTESANNDIRRLSKIFIKKLESSPIINRKMLLNSPFNKQCYKSDLLSHLNYLHVRKDYGKIFTDFVPLGGKQACFSQDDQNYSLKCYYEKSMLENIRKLK